VQNTVEHYVTLFNQIYLPQGISLYLSMERCISGFKLWVVCADDTTYTVLDKINYPHMELINLSEVVTKELCSVREERTVAEFCWTLTPFAPRFVFEKDPDLKRVTYVDADIWFRKDPAPIFDELDCSNKSVLITDHGYTPNNDRSSTVGQYCVQFIIFNKDTSEPVRSDWERKCLDWCYNKVEDGRFADQKYLDSWPTDFKTIVHVLSRQDWTLASWNCSRFPYGQSIIYHFHDVRVKENGRFRIANRNYPQVLIDNIYRPYFDDLTHSIELLNKNNFQVIAQRGNYEVIAKIKNLKSHIINKIRFYNDLVRLRF
jgi:hypothetical protein